MLDPDRAHLLSRRSVLDATSAVAIVASLVASLCATIVACGHVASDGAAIPNADVDADAARWAAASCDWIARCVPLQFRHFSGDATRCRDGMTADVRATLTDPHLRLPPGWVDACIRGLETRACDPTSPVPECIPPRGSASEGTTCFFDGDCVPELTCARVGSTADPEGQECGTCTVPTGPCAACGPDEACGPGNVCAPRIPLGAPCTYQGCVAGAQCAGASGDMTCTALAHLGGTCDPARPTCEIWTFCDAGTHTCVEDAIAGLGAACDGPGVLCGPEGYCDSDVTHRCVAKAERGEHCDDRAGPICDPFDRCRGGVCVAPDSTVCR